jgi:hypothetical protein
MGENLAETAFLRAKETLRQRIQQGPLAWKWKSVLLNAEKKEEKYKKNEKK